MLVAKRETRNWNSVLSFRPTIHHTRGNMDRRKFISGVALTSAGLATGAAAQNDSTQNTSKSPKTMTEAVGPKRAVIISKSTGMQASDGAYELLRRGHDTLEAVTFIL